MNNRENVNLDKEQIYELIKGIYIKALKIMNENLKDELERRGDEK